MKRALFLLLLLSLGWLAFDYWQLKEDDAELESRLWSVELLADEAKDEAEEAKSEAERANNTLGQ